MANRILPYLTAVLFLTLAMYLVFWTMSPGRFNPALGQAVSQGDGFIMATEQGSDGSPICFLLDARGRHLLIYKSSTSGQLQLTSARDIQYDLLLPDNYMPRGQVSASGQTTPPVKIVRDATKSLHSPRQVQKKKKP